MTIQSNKNRNTIFITSTIGIIIAIFVASLPTWRQDCEWGICISISGTILSLTALIIAVIEIYGMKKSNVAVTDAVKSAEKTIQKISNLYDISRHTQMINEIHTFINSEKWELAHLRMVELNAIINNIKNNPATYCVTQSDVAHHVISIRDDLRSLNTAINNSGKINKEIILNHLDDIAPFLVVICSKLKSNGNDER